MTEETDYFHRLGLSSHKNTLRNIQEKISKNYDEDVTQWKDVALEEIKKASLFNEVLANQDQINKVNNMEVCTIDFAEDKVSSFPSYTQRVYTACVDVLPESYNHFHDYDDIVLALDKVEKTTKTFL